MVTILELTQMSENLNNVGSPTPTIGSLLAGLSSNWTVVATSATLPTNNTNWTDGYFGVVYRNTVAGTYFAAGGTGQTTVWQFK